ncbi:MAG: PAS domain S-box protein, partial [Myxococcales bacterium]|nr:PAS domain S-box protein [Myxococcales bacterium]
MFGPLAMCLAILALDVRAELGMSTALLYVAPLFWVATRGSTRGVLVVAAVSVVGTFVGWWLSPTGPAAVVAIYNRLMSVFVVATTSVAAILHQRSLAELGESEQLYRAVVDRAADGIVVIDERGAIESFNPAAERIFGVSADEVRGKNVGLLMPEPDRSQHQKHVERYLRTGESKIVGSARQVIGARWDGTQFPLTVALAHVDLRDRQLFTGIVRDISAQVQAAEALKLRTEELARANDELAQRNLELDEFNFVASHDLQEPVRKLISFGELLRRDLGDQLPKDAERDLQYIVDAAQRMNLMIRDLLELARTGRSTMARSWISLDLCLDDALEPLTIRAGELGATITRKPLPYAFVDEGMIRRLFMNLVLNALKFHGKEPPRIEIGAEFCETGWVVGVRDHGIGVKPEHANVIFNPFKRLHGRS